jgi:hypothetical protein
VVDATCEIPCQQSLMFDDGIVCIEIACFYKSYNTLNHHISDKQSHLAIEVEKDT